MQATEQKSQGLKRQFKIVVEAAHINGQMEAELKAAGERVRIPGFRPGYIPMKVLQQRYGKTVQADVLKQVINRTTSELLNQKKIRPATAPKVDIDAYENDGDLTYTMSVETFPEVPEIKFDGIKIERKIFEIEQSEIDKAIASLAERTPKLEKAKSGGAAKKGQIVEIDFKGSIDGVAFEGGEAKNFKLELGSGQFIEGFEDQLIGAKEGDDKIVNVTFPKDYPGEKLAAKDAAFAVKVHGIYNKEAPAIDDAFAKEKGFDDLAALRAAVKEQMSREYDQIVRSQLKRQLFDALDEKYNFELPETMLKMEFDTIWERLKEAQAQGDKSVADKSDEVLKEEYMSIAKRRVKLGILLAEIGNRQKLAVTREEMSRAMMQQASMFPGQEQQVMEFYRKNPDRADDLRGPLIEEKAVDYILSQISFKDRKVSLEELAEEDAEGESDTKKSESKAGEKSSAKKKSSKE